MGFEGLLDTEEERGARRLIDQAGRILTGLHGDMPESFAAQLFARAAPEGLVRYAARELAALAEDPWRFLKERKSGKSSIRFDSRNGPMGAERIKSISVIEIVNDDMPFLLDSVMGELTEQGIEVRLVVHPIFSIERDRVGTLVGFHGDGPAIGAARRESFIHIHVERVDDEARRAEIVRALEQVLADVRVCVQDWRPMMSRVAEVIAELRNNPPDLPVDEIAEAVQFLEWLVANNFTFLGVREYGFAAGSGEIEPKFETGMGILRAHDVFVLRRGTELVSMTPEIMEFLKEPKTLIITKANVRSRVHRRVYMDYIGIKRFDPERGLAGEFRIVGLFTSTVYTRSTRTIPYLRRKVDAVMKRAGFDPDSHSGKALINVLESYPRDELFQVDEDTLFTFALATLALDERPRARVRARRDRFGRFVSVIVFVPRDRYDSERRTRIGAYLAQVYDGHVSAYYPAFPEGALARVHFIIGRAGGPTPDPSQATLEEAVAAIARSWSDGLATALEAQYDPTRATALGKRYGAAFPPSYRDDFRPDTAFADIDSFERLTRERPIAGEFRPLAEEGRIGLRL